EKMDFPDETFDLAVSRFGFQIFTNPETVAKETLRVLVPRGRIGVAVWSTAEKASAIHAVVGPMLEFAEPDETGYLPTPYELGGPGEVVKLFEDAGFHETKEGRKTHTMALKDAGWRRLESETGATAFEQHDVSRDLVDVEVSLRGGLHESRGGGSRSEREERDPRRDQGPCHESGGSRRLVPSGGGGRSDAGGMARADGADSRSMACQTARATRRLGIWPDGGLRAGRSLKDPRPPLISELQKRSGLDVRDREAEALSTLPRPPTLDGVL